MPGMRTSCVSRLTERQVTEPLGLAAAHGDEVPFRGFENAFGPLLLTAIFVVATTIRTATLADPSSARS